MVQLNENIEAIQEKHETDLCSDFLCAKSQSFFEFGYAEFSFRQDHLSVKLKKSPHFVLSASFMGKLNKCAA